MTSAICDPAPGAEVEGESITAKVCSCYAAQGAALHHLRLRFGYRRACVHSGPCNSTHKLIMEVLMHLYTNLVDTHLGHSVGHCI